MPQVDYDALAAQHGGTQTVDYDALAQQHGGTVTAAAAPGLLSQAGTLAKDLGVGALKGAGQSAVNLGKAVQWVPGVKPAIDALYGTPGIASASMHEADRVLTPANTTQKVGKGAEQLAEMIVPGGALREAGLAAGTKLAPTLTQSLGPILARALPRAVVEGAGSAAISKVQGGSGIVGGVLGAAGPLASEAIATLPDSLKTTAEKKVVEALGPTKERFKAIAARLAPQILQRGLGGSREALQAQAASTLETVGDQLDAAMTQVGGQAVGTHPILAALETAKDAFRTTMPRGNVVEFEPRAIKQLNGLQQIVTDLGPQATVAQLTAIRQAWDKVVSQAGGYAQRAGGAIGVPLKDQSEAFAKREGATAIRSLLATEVPDLAAINKEWSFWKNLDDVVTQTLQRTQPQGPGLLKQGAELGGQVIGGMAGSTTGPAGTIGGAVAAGKIAKLATTAFASPRWKLVDARLRNALADAIIGGKPGPILGTLTRISAVEGSKVPAALSESGP